MAAPASKVMEKRKYKRVGVSIPAGVYLKDDPHAVIDAEILDISEGGAFIHCMAPIAIGQEVLVEIRFGETKYLDGKVVPHLGSKGASPENIRERSVVCWARGSNRSGFGIQFLGLKPEKREFLAKLIKYFEQNRPPIK